MCVSIILVLLGNKIWKPNRENIFAFLDLNSRNPTKEAVLKTLDEAILNFDLKQEIQRSLKILKLAR